MLTDKLLQTNTFAFMKKIFLFLLPVVMMGMFAACENENEEDEIGGGSNGGSDSSLGISANQVKIGDVVTSFNISDTLTVQEGAMRVLSMGGAGRTQKGAVATIWGNYGSQFIGKDIDLSLTILKDSVYDDLTFGFEIDSLAGMGSMYAAFDWGRTERVLEGALGSENVSEIFKSGTLRMDMDMSKKIFTLKIGAILYNDLDFKLYVAIPFNVKYIFHFYHYSHETFDNQTYESYTSFEEFYKADSICGIESTFTLEAADTSAQAKFATFKQAIRKFSDLINVIDDDKARAGFYSDKDRYVIKLITWGFGGHNRVLASKHWYKNKPCETWIPSDEYIYSTLLYYPGDEDYGEYEPED